MSLVAAADYTVRLRDPAAGGEDFISAVPRLPAFAEGNRCYKKTKGETQTDIRPLILEIHPLQSRKH